MQELKRYMILLLLFVPMMLFGQEPASKTVTVREESVLLGHDCITKDSIPAVLYRFNRSWGNISTVDTPPGTILIRLGDVTKNGKGLRTEGSLIALSLSKGEIAWERPVKYIHQTDIWADSALLVCAGLLESVSVDLNTGQELWKSRDRFYYIPSSSDGHIGVGYQISQTEPGGVRMRGIDLSSGKTIWKRGISQMSGWNGYSMLDDSTMLVTMGGLHRINLNTGAGWSYMAGTAESFLPPKKKIYLYSRVFREEGEEDEFVHTSGFFPVGSLCSNTIISDSVIYWAAQDHIAALSESDGNVLWKTRLPDNAGSLSNIFETDTLIYMINRGMAVYSDYTGRYYGVYGRPFIASFSKQTGRITMLQPIDQRRCSILDYGFVGDSVLLALEDRIAVHDFRSGKMGRETLIDTSRVGRIVRNVDHMDYYRYDTLAERFHRFERLSNEWDFRTDKNNLLRWNVSRGDGNVTSLDSCWVQYGRYDNLLLVGRGARTCLIDENGRKYAELDMPCLSLLLGKILYAYTKEGLVKMDLTPVLEHRYQTPEVPQGESLPVAEMRRAVTIVES